jgi:hypothetical protein
MDLTQRKLTKSEWNSVEVPVSLEEKEVLLLIIEGFHNVNVKYNKNVSLLSYLKVENTGEMEDYLFVTYFSKRLQEMERKFEISFVSVDSKTRPTIKKADMIRLEKTSMSKIVLVYEAMLIDIVEKMFK